MIDDAAQLQRQWFDGKTVVGLTAGASAPESLVQGVVTQLREWGAAAPQDLAGRAEHIVFSMPKALRAVQRDR
mgnify:FL=1